MKRDYIRAELTIKSLRRDAVLTDSIELPIDEFPQSSGIDLPIDEF